VLSIVTLLAAFTASVLGTRAFIDWLAARQLVAVENDRTMHQGRIPQGGGAPVIAAVIGVTGLLWPWSWQLGWVFAAAAGCALISASNDQREIPFLWRLAAHAVGSAVVVQTTLGAAQLLPVLPVWIERCLEIAALVWYVNLYNFMDGIDGITGVETMTIAGGALLVMYAGGGTATFTGVAWSLVGASAGFLVWNWHRARIFLGDVGSIPLGLLTGALLLHLAANVSLVAAVILPLYYLTDATGTLLTRLRRGETPWQAHRSHAYQRAALRVGSHSNIVLRITLCNAVLILAAVAAVRWPVIGSGVAVGAVALLMVDLERIAATGVTTRAR
jgi:UDP-N-acetylmuramyl pentapeptide phosphotransferase/UDP-N-acetylglucosamine-1-phosphate transferase